jgi:hypothetical protein
MSSDNEGGNAQYTNPEVNDIRMRDDDEKIEAPADRVPQAPGLNWTWAITLLRRYTKGFDPRAGQLPFKATGRVSIMGAPDIICYAGADVIAWCGNSFRDSTGNPVVAVYEHAPADDDDDAEPVVWFDKHQLYNLLVCRGLRIVDNFVPLPNAMPDFERLGRTERLRRIEQQLDATYMKGLKENPRFHILDAQLNDKAVVCFETVRAFRLLVEASGDQSGPLVDALRGAERALMHHYPIVAAPDAPAFSPKLDDQFAAYDQQERKAREKHLARAAAAEAADAAAGSLKRKFVLPPQCVSDSPPPLAASAAVAAAVVRAAMKSEDDDDTDDDMPIMQMAAKRQKMEQQ